MPFEDLIKAVQDSAEEKIREIRQRAQIETEGILLDARSKEEKITQRDLDAAKHSLELDKIRQIAALREEAKMHLAKQKDELYQRSFREAERKLENARQDLSYSAIFRRLLQEAWEEKPEGEGVVVHIDPRDDRICRDVLKDLKTNSQIMTDLHSLGGLTITSADQTTIIQNTFESRLAMAKEQVRAEVFSILFGE